MRTSFAPDARNAQSSGVVRSRENAEEGLLRASP
jgi:hypothetical protein